MGHPPLASVTIFLTALLGSNTGRRLINRVIAIFSTNNKIDDHDGDHRKPSTNAATTSYLLSLLLLTTIWWFVPPHSVVATFWYHATLLLTQLWPVLLALCCGFHLRRGGNVGGPLGPNYYKLCQVFAGAILWKLSRNRFPPVFLVGSAAGHVRRWPSLGGLALLVVLSVAVNLVLLLWSRFFKTKGNHEGVEKMVKKSLGRELSGKEKCRLLFLALTNAACEEVTSRGLWRLEFEIAGCTSVESNVGQALIFGAWHYHGIPSGMTGVLLTTVYGFIMALFADYNDGGLLMPILAHTVADYFIFTFIARQQLQG